MTTYTTLSTDSDFNLKLNGLGNLVLTEDIKALADTCTRALSAMAGEFQFDITKGVDYQNTIFRDGISGGPSFEASARETLKSISGVLDVTAFVYDIEDNTFYFAAEVTTEFGEITLVSGA